MGNPIRAPGWLAVIALIVAPTGSVAQQLTPAGTGGLAALERALARLDQNKRVLLIAAHPDDEDTELLTLLSRGMGVDAAYLSLSRGEGGQNLIGPELGEQLGLIRTGELLAARSVDGARQFFTRAFDFGFSKTLAETERFWPRDTLLADVLAVIRRFRPQIIVTTFRGTPRDGHGQHQLSALLGRQAFELLRDSAWGPVKLYRTTRFDASPDGLAIPNGGLDPVDGRSYLQVALASRSLHRSQDMGQIQRVGPSTVRLELTALSERRLTQRVGPSDALFLGVDTALPRSLDRYRALVDSARRIVHPRRLDALVPLLTAATHELTRGPDGFRAARQDLLFEAIATAAGIVFDATIRDAPLAPGQQTSVSAVVWNSGPTQVAYRAVTLEAPPGWSTLEIDAGAQEDGGPSFYRTGRVPTTTFVVQAPRDAAPSTPYFLVRPRRGELYDWSAADWGDGLAGEPLDPPLLRARFRLIVAGTEIVVAREVTHRSNDQALGEIRRPLTLVPAVGVTLHPETVVWPTDAATRQFDVELVNGRRDTVSGFVRLVMPDGWPAVAPQPFTLTGAGARRAFTFQVRAPAALAPGSYEIRAVAETEGWGRDSRASVTIDYPHIRPMTWVREAKSRVAAAPIALPRLRAVGYLRGASDRVPEALASVGVPVAALTPAVLERGDLAAYDVIVVGSRAYETEPALVANNARLLEWVRGGGRLVVQYQQYAFVSGGFAPLPLTIARPHDRVTDERSAVTLLDPSHPVFRTPNAISPTDWEGWVQERGLYFARQWDGAYQPLLELSDEGERLRGGLLVARYGRGLYMYTGLAFFRQLPAGVPGAFRLLLNLLALRPDDVP